VTVPDRVRLPLRFEIAPLEAEIDALGDEAWVPHFNQSVYEGEWSGVALRSVGGLDGQLYPDPAAAGPYADTPALQSCPALRAVIETFRCPVQAARLLALAPGAVIKEHRDYCIGLDEGEVRVHIPILTSGEVEFVLDGGRVDMAAGEAWYLDVSRPHQVTNRATTRRVHLVLDCVVDGWFRAQLEGGQPSPGD
jgi:hypothetical protein